MHELSEDLAGDTDGPGHDYGEGTEASGEPGRQQFPVKAIEAGDGASRGYRCRQARHKGEEIAANCRQTAPL